MRIKLKISSYVFYDHDDDDVVVVNHHTLYQPTKQDKSIATMSAEERRLQAKKVNLGVDVRHGTVVCRHWLNKLCLKGGNCEFLHQLDLDRLPECQNGMNCEIEGCELRHEDEDEKFQCRLFRQGFCPNGPNCPYRHKLLDASKRPENADLVQIGESSNTEGGSAGDSDNYRTALCRHFSTKGSCPYGAKCLYAHGQHQLRRRTAGTISAPKRNLITPSTELKVVDEEVHLKELQALITKGLIVAVPNTQMLEQCLNLGIFAMPMHQQGLAMGVVPGSIIFAADRSTEQVYVFFFNVAHIFSLILTYTLLQNNTQQIHTHTQTWNI